MVKNKMQQDTTLTEYPSIHWKKFFDKFQEIDTLPLDKWNSTHMIALFCKRYEQYYGLKYTFKFNNNAPSKSYEVYQINKLANMLSSDPTILTDYITWFFDMKIIARKKRITSMAFMLDTKIVNEYKFNKLLPGKNVNIDRSTILPPNYIKVITGFGQNISTYGDLALIKRCIDNNSVDDPKLQEMMLTLKNVGLDISSLDRVK